jgi:hypothetical protein
MKIICVTDAGFTNLQWNNAPVELHILYPYSLGDGATRPPVSAIRRARLCGTRTAVELAARPAVKTSNRLFSINRTETRGQIKPSTRQPDCMSRADNVNCATHHSARSRTRARQSARPDAVSCHHTGFHCSLLSARRQPTRARKRHTSVHARFTVHFGAVRGCGFGGLYSSHPVAWPPRALDVGVMSSQVKSSRSRPVQWFQLQV